MNKLFDKDDFIRKNNEISYRLLENFLKTELNKETFSTIYRFLEWQNFRCGEYEGNQYLIQKQSVEEVRIIDIVSEEFCDDFSQTRISIRVTELLKLMDEMAETK
ncbi:hypothetical protein [Azotosporobacter soli]|uniref:hypothetical protein n=1 Tax=Azotosporobacter soli TaxID=3055040 RepID=UPI0031FE87F6